MLYGMLIIFFMYLYDFTGKQDWDITSESAPTENLHASHEIKAKHLLV